MNNSLDAQEEPNAEEVVVARTDDHEYEQSVEQFRPRRSNAGRGIERIQMEFIGKACGTRRELCICKNDNTIRTNKEATQQRTCMQMATSDMFNQMSANKGVKKHGQTAIVAIIKAFTQLNNGSVLGNPVVGPIN